MENIGVPLKRSTPVLIEWRNHYSVGNAELDQHHKVILSIINEILVMLEKGADSSALESILAHLADYANWHFRREEELMEQRQCPGLDTHKRAHAHFVKDLEAFRFQNLTPKGLKPNDLLRYLKRWWLDHICKVDRKYRSCVGEASPAGNFER
ncbi:MAG TPA: bacteriohemerythrin [Planctomycetes bacterium]|nr:bacteriohemerythrin [Planctomycetota bacterium]